MKAVILNNERRHELVEVPDPTPGPHEVLIRSEFCGICGSDLHAPDIEMFQAGIISGHEFAGEIVAMGSGVTAFSVGQRVTANPNGNTCNTCQYCRQGRYNLCFAATHDNALGVARHGGMAEYVALDTSYVHALPDNLDTRHGAWTEPLAVALRAVRTTSVQIGDTAAVIGGGPVGQLVLQLLHKAGVSRTVMLEPSPFRCAMATTLGADLAMTPEELTTAIAEGDFPEVDHVFECSGFVGAIRSAQSMVAAGGTIRLVGMSPTPPTFDAIDLVTREVKLLGGFIYVDEFPLAIQLLASGGVDVDTLTTHLTPLEKFSDAFAALRQPEQAMKVLVQL